MRSNAASLSRRRCSLFGDEGGTIGGDIRLNLCIRHRGTLRTFGGIGGGIRCIGGGLLRAGGTDGRRELFDVADHRRAFGRVKLQEIADDLTLLRIQRVPARIGIHLRVNVAPVHRPRARAQPLLGNVEFGTK